jgi:hypothetical protein
LLQGGNGNATLKELGLQYCGIGDDCAAVVARVLRVNKSLQVLYLSFNIGIGNNGAIALAQSLPHNKSLKKLVGFSFSDDKSII